MSAEAAGAVWGVGTDILLMDRVRRLRDPDDPFYRKAFTPAERAMAARRPEPALFYATRFCAKEAVFKALRMELCYFDMREIELGYDAAARPTARLLGRLAEQAARRGIGGVDVSISYDSDYCVAFAVALTVPAGNTAE